MDIKTKFKLEDMVYHLVYGYCSVIRIKTVSAIYSRITNISIRYDILIKNENKEIYGVPEEELFSNKEDGKKHVDLIYFKN